MLQPLQEKFWQKKWNSFPTEACCSSTIQLSIQPVVWSIQHLSTLFDYLHVQVSHTICTSIWPRRVHFLMTKCQITCPCKSFLQHTAKMGGPICVWTKFLSALYTFSSQNQEFQSHDTTFVLSTTVPCRNTSNTNRTSPLLWRGIHTPQVCALVCGDANTLTYIVLSQKRVSHAILPYELWSTLNLQTTSFPHWPRAQKGIPIVCLHQTLGMLVPHTHVHVCVPER